MEPTAILIPNNEFRQERQAFCPSTDWSVGGWIIEREKIGITCTLNCPSVWYADVWRSVPDLDDLDFARGEGPTPLIAAMRALVAAKYGEEVPDEGEGK